MTDDERQWDTLCNDGSTSINIFYLHLYHISTKDNNDVSLTTNKNP